MKVLKKGSGQKGWSTKAKCTGNGNGGGGCGAELLVEKSDLYKTHHDSYDGSRDSYVTFACPECEVETDLSETKSGAVSSSIPDKEDWMKRHASLPR